jgi:hypothetical protein
MALGTCITEKEGCYCSKVVSWRLLPGFVFCVGGGGVGLYTLYADNGVLWPILQAIDEDVLPKILRKSPWWYFGVLDGCVMTINGFSFQTHTPFQTEVERPKDNHFH